MGFRYHRRIKIAKGIWFNVGKKYITSLSEKVGPVNDHFVKQQLVG